MTTNDDMVYRFAEYTGTPEAHLVSQARAGRTVYVSGYDPRNLLSYGEHYILARLMLDENGQRSWWLLNGDLYSVSTSRHQAMAREHCQRTGLPCLIVPFSSLERAGIGMDSITVVDVQKERNDEITHHAAQFDDIPNTHADRAVQLPDGRWQWVTWRHWLGASLFAANYRAAGWNTDGSHYNHADRAWFLSAFDDQETRPHYFLCQLPYDPDVPDVPAPATVDQAFEWLKPAEVITAEQAGAVCTRQGDLFAVPTTLTTRQISALGERTKRTHVTVPALTWDADPTRVTISHTATEVVHGSDGNTYGRGVLYHQPTEWGREPEHRRQRMGDGRTWHQLLKNTVPVDRKLDNRAWSSGGNVD